MNHLCASHKALGLQNKSIHICSMLMLDLIQWCSFKPLSVNLTKWSNTLKQFVRKFANELFLSMFNHFVGLVLKGLRREYTERLHLIALGFTYFLVFVVNPLFPYVQVGWHLQDCTTFLQMMWECSTKSSTKIMLIYTKIS